jgi:hypothetical protein
MNAHANGESRDSNAPDAHRPDISLKIGCVLLAIVGVAILLFGLIASVIPDVDARSFVRSTGVATIGMGLFGLLITLKAYRRRERWAWFALWYYPAFWIAHLVGGLPPGKEHVHQVVFMILSLAGLLLPVREFFPPPARTPAR